jgi:uncharacterized protein YutE (UPF0331/DUF86 family)
MKEVPINVQLIEERLREIRDDIKELTFFKGMSLEDFKKGQNFAIAEHYLRRALQAFIDITTHILSRQPGPKPTGYKEAVLLLGELNIIPEDFAKEKLTKMAGYRNRLVHFYHLVTKEELFNIIQNNLSDLEEFCKYIVEYIPKQK